MLDCVFVVGHNKEKQGSYGVRENGERSLSEYSFNLKLALQLCCGKDLTSFSRCMLVRTPYGGPHHQDQRVLDQIEELNPKCVVELHFNWLDPKIFGPDRWQYKCITALFVPDQLDTDSQDLGEEVVSEVIDLLELPKRKVQKQYYSWERSRKNRDDRWTPSGPELLLLTKGSRPGIILEHHTGNDPSSHEAALETLEDGTLAGAIALGVQAWLDKK